MLRKGFKKGIKKRKPKKWWMHVGYTFISYTIVKANKSESSLSVQHMPSIWHLPFLHRLLSSSSPWRKGLFIHLITERREGENKTQTFGEKIVIYIHKGCKLLFETPFKINVHQRVIYQRLKTLRSKIICIKFLPFCLSDSSSELHGLHGGLCSLIFSQKPKGASKNAGYILTFNTNLWAWFRDWMTSKCGVCIRFYFRVKKV